MALPLPESSQQLDSALLLNAFRTMLTSRCFDDKEIALKHQNRVYFQLSGAGHEAISVATAMVLRSGYDWLFPHVRDRALCLFLGLSPYEQFLASVAARTDEISGARQMPSHWGCKRLKMPSRSSCIGMQFLHAVGVAEAAYRQSLIPESVLPIEAHPEEIVYVGSGEGATSEGEFWESLNTSCNLRLPVLYVVQDNGYAISVPVEVQTAGGSISALVRGFPNLWVEECDGTDFATSYASLVRASDHCRKRQGPALVHARVVRPYSHSTSDDESSYRSASELDEQLCRDPIRKLERHLLSKGIVTGEQLEQIRAGIDEEINAAAEKALGVPHASPESADLFVYSPEIDPASTEYDTENDVEEDSGQSTMVDLINRCLHAEMARDSKILVMGQDVADASRSEILAHVKGKGGVFKATSGLQRVYGDARVFNTPLAEANIIGRAVGLALRGFKPIPEIQFFDYIWPAYMQLHNEVPLMRWRSNNAWKCPMVVRVPIGGYIRGGAIYHNQSGVSLFTHVPGWRVVMPSNAIDACGLLRTAIRCDDPVLFLEHKYLYRQSFNRGDYPGDGFMVPFAKARVAHSGTSASIITYGALVQKSVQVANQFSDRGIEIEVLDLRSLNPYDWNAISTTVKKTHRVLIAYEDSMAWGYGAEIAARIAGELFDDLDAPVARVAARNCFVSYTPGVEEFTLPQTNDLVQELEFLLSH
jgi:2-oxoisovalerate dehydrogenase E1 component